MQDRVLKFRKCIFKFGVALAIKVLSALSIELQYSTFVNSNLFFYDQEIADEKSNSGTTKEPFCKQKMHRKVLDKGVPEDVMPGLKDTKVSESSGED